MVSIELTAQARTTEELVFILQEVVNQIEQGYHCGYQNADWSIQGEEEEDKED